MAGWKSWFDRVSIVLTLVFFHVVYAIAFLILYYLRLNADPFFPVPMEGLNLYLFSGTGGVLAALYALALYCLKRDFEMRNLGAVIAVVLALELLGLGGCVYKVGFFPKEGAMRERVRQIGQTADVINRRLPQQSDEGAILFRVMTAGNNVTYFYEPPSGAFDKKKFLELRRQHTCHQLRYYLDRHIFSSVVHVVLDGNPPTSLVVSLPDCKEAPVKAATGGAP